MVPSDTTRRFALQQVQQETTEKTALPRFFTLEMFMFTVAVLSLSLIHI